MGGRRWLTACLLSSAQMASFVARGIPALRTPRCPRTSISSSLDEVGASRRNAARVVRKGLCEAAVGERLSRRVPAGTPLAQAYRSSRAITRMLELPVVARRHRESRRPNPTFDHHFLHVTFPPEFYEARGLPNVSQHTHQDSTIDPRRAFDVQIMY
jgi:hypothetical protein